MYLYKFPFTKKKKSYWKGFWRGLGSVIYMYNTPKYKMITDEDIAGLVYDKK